jgi:hypothetical protein
MASRGSPDRSTLPGVVPFDLPRATRLSWRLGTRVIDGDEATRRGRWEHTTAWSLSLFRVTDETAVLRVRTPIGRERFYGAAWIDLEESLPRLDATPTWTRAT